jgi:hypothetical protein
MRSQIETQVSLSRIRNARWGGRTAYTVFGSIQTVWCHQCPPVLRYEIKFQFVWNLACASSGAEDLYARDNTQNKRHQAVEVYSVWPTTRIGCSGL